MRPNVQVTSLDGPSRAILYARVSTKEQAERNGDPEGYSIPAQREACHRKAESLGATVTDEFVDRGESARSADRTELQNMLKFLKRETVDFVIVHKIDRLARNRTDDVAITAAILASGARLVSVSEAIDETPSGLLLHGIMSSIAEFYSRNLAAEVMKGTQQKFRSGGTVTLAPPGYLNVLKVIDGREVRTVEVDTERAPLIQWAFDAYASGDWTLSQLADELQSRGLTQRPTRKRAARPSPANKLHEVLRNRYYLGYVRYRGVENDGNHEALTSPDLFARVQAVLEQHRTSGERSYRQKHYLAGSLRCFRCGSRMGYGISTGRAGDPYGYFFCLGRHSEPHGLHPALSARAACRSGSGSSLGQGATEARTGRGAASPALGRLRSARRAQPGREDRSCDQGGRRPAATHAVGRKGDGRCRAG
jgi:site-specific DNA recombinase